MWAITETNPKRLMIKILNKKNVETMRRMLKTRIMNKFAIGRILYFLLTMHPIKHSTGPIEYIKLEI